MFISPEPAGQFQSNFVQIIPLVKGSLNCSNKRPGPLQKGDKNQKIWRGY
jgi:hypothetical protein